RDWSSDVCSSDLILGALKAIPGSTAISTSVAPPIVIPYRFIEKTGLLQFGSRKEYQFFYKTTETTDLDLFEKELQPKLEIENADLNTHTSASKRLGQSYSNVVKFRSEERRVGKECIEW